MCKVKPGNHSALPRYITRTCGKQLVQQDFSKMQVFITGDAEEVAEIGQNRKRRQMIQSCSDKQDLFMSADIFLEPTCLPFLSDGASRYLLSCVHTLMSSRDWERFSC